MTEKIKKILQKEVEAISNIPVNDSFEKAVDLIIEQVHNKGGKVVISGMGKAGQIGLNIGTTLSSTGTPAIFLHPSESQHGYLGIIQKNDVLLLVSSSGRTREIIEMNVLVKNLYPNIKIIGLTGNLERDLAQFADVVLYTGSPKEVCPLGLTPTTSTTTMTVIGDILIVLLMEKIGFTKEEYAKRHHSGYLGSKARNEVK